MYCTGTLDCCLQMTYFDFIFQDQLLFWRWACSFLCEESCWSLPSVSIPIFLTLLIYALWLVYWLGDYPSSSGLGSLQTGHWHYDWPKLRYCRVSIKLTPLHDHDMPDEILVLSPCLEGCDEGKNSSGVTVFWAIPSIFIVKLVVAVSHQGKRY